MRRGAGFELVFDSLEAQACRPYNLGYFGEGATKKNHVLPPDTGKGVLKESGPAKTLFFSSCCFDSLEAQGVSTLQNLAVCSQFGVFFGRVPLKNKVLPPDTVGFD